MSTPNTPPTTPCRARPRESPAGPREWWTAAPVSAATRRAVWPPPFECRGAVLVTGQDPGWVETVLECLPQRCSPVAVAPGLLPVGPESEALEPALARLSAWLEGHDKPRFFGLPPGLCAHSVQGLRGCQRCIAVWPTGPSAPRAAASRSSPISARVVAAVPRSARPVRCAMPVPIGPLPWTACEAPCANAPCDKVFIATGRVPLPSVSQDSGQEVARDALRLVQCRELLPDRVPGRDGQGATEGLLAMSCPAPDCRHSSLNSRCLIDTLTRASAPGSSSVRGSRRRTEAVMQPQRSPAHILGAVSAPETRNLDTGPGCDGYNPTQLRAWCPHEYTRCRVTDCGSGHRQSPPPPTHI